MIPVGDPGTQTLRKLTRRGEDHYDEEILGAVAFVPLIGEAGWREDGRRTVKNDVAGMSRE